LNSLLLEKKKDQLVPTAPNKIEAQKNSEPQVLIFTSTA